MENINRKAYLDKHHNFTIKNESIPRPRKSDVIIRIKANGICGSDIHFFSEGKLGNFVVTKPYVPGHECSGEIVELGCDVKDFSIGDRVTIEPGIPCGRCNYCKSGRYNLCDDVVFLSAPPINGTFCDYISIRSDMVYHLPDNVSFEEGSLTEPISVAVHAVNRANFRNASTAAIIGAGPIGLLTIQAFKAAGGGKVICLDINDERLSFAKKIGADEIIKPAAHNQDLECIADVIFETAGSDKATSSLFSYANKGGSVIQVGWPGSNIVKMDISKFIDKELNYIAVNRYANAYPTAIQWISDGRIDLKNIITHKFTLNQIQEAFEFTKNNPNEVIKTVIVNE